MRYCKVTLNVFFDKKNYDDDKKKYSFYRHFVSNRNSTTEHIRIVEISRFFVQNSRLKKNFKFQDFLRVLGKVATLMIS